MHVDILPVWEARENPPSLERLSAQMAERRSYPNNYLVKLLPRKDIEAEKLSEFIQAILSKLTTGNQTLSLFTHTSNTDCIL